MPMLNNRGGFTLIEVVVAGFVMTLIMVGAVSMMVSSVTCLENTGTRTYTDTDAVTAMQVIVNDVREAKEVNPIANGERLRVVFPVRVHPAGYPYSQGYYDRHTPAMADQIDYYLSDSTGVPGHAGTILWQGKNNNNRRPLAKDITGLSFEKDDYCKRTIKITITAKNAAFDGVQRKNTDLQTTLTQRVVYLRNF